MAWTFKPKRRYVADAANGIVNGSGVLANNPASNIPYIWASLSVLLLGIIAIVVIALIRPTIDIGVLTLVVSGFIVTIGGVAATFIKATQTDKTVNSRMGEMLVLVEEAAHLRGIKEGIERQTAAAVDAAFVVAKAAADAAALLAKATADAAALVASATALAVAPLSTPAVPIPAVPVPMSPVPPVPHIPPT